MNLNGCKYGIGFFIPTNDEDGTFQIVQLLFCKHYPTEEDMKKIMEEIKINPCCGLMPVADRVKGRILTGVILEEAAEKLGEKIKGILKWNT